MNMLEALKEVYEDASNKGARPVSWKGTASCMVWADLKEDGQLWIVRTMEGFQVAPLPGPEVFENWEVVNLTTILEEQKPFESEIQKLQEQLASISGSK